MDITTVGAAVSGAFGLFKSLAEAVGAIKDQKVKAELHAVIIPLQTEIMRVQQENMTLQDENRRLKDDASERVNAADYKFENNAYWKDGLAYCPNCMQGTRKARSLVHNNIYSPAGKCVCCDKVFAVFRARVVHAPKSVRDRSEL